MKTKYPNVTLTPVTVDNHEAVFALDVTDAQRPFIASNVLSVAHAYLYPGAEPYAIQSASQGIVGFTLLYSNVDADLPSMINIVRFMIDKNYQRLGYGRGAIQAIIDEVNRRGRFDTIQLSVVPENEAAIRLYELSGFEDTGEIIHHEQVYRLKLR